MNDRAKGYLLDGKIKSSILNYGNFIDWTSFPAGLWGDYAYLPHVGFMAGVPGHLSSAEFSWDSIIININGVDKYRQSGFIYSSDLEIVGNTVYVAAVSQISVYDITNPYDIIELGEYDEPNDTPWYAITVRGDLAYVAAGADGLFVLDISDITNIIFVIPELMASATQ